MNPDLANLNFRSHERVVILNQDKRGFLQWNDRPQNICPMLHDCI